MLRKCVVMLIFGRVRLLRNYAFDICVSVFHLFTCVIASLYGIGRTMRPGNKHQLNVFQIT